MQKKGAIAVPVHARAVLTPDNLALIDAVARTGSMAAAARELGLVPSALTYRVRQVEDALDVLLFDRSARQARITPAGAELLRSGEHLLRELDAVAQRVKRVATGWEPQLTIVADNLVSRGTLLELCQDFYELGAPTRLRLLPCEGTYFQCVDYSGLDPAIAALPEAAFCEWLTREVGVAAIPLSAFYSDGHNQQIARLCFAKKDETLHTALERLRRHLG